LILLAWAVLTFPVYRDYLDDNFSLYQNVKAFRQLKHPSDTSRISFKKYLGLLLGNGNHCDSFIGEPRRYGGEQQTIESYYDSTTIADDQGMGIIFIESGEFPEESLYWVFATG